jgi:hypothetical protein
MSKSAWVSALIFSAIAGTVVRADVERKIEVLARGPLHEAYAQPWEANPSPNQTIEQPPPEPLIEEPPDERPKGNNVQWIPGYWQWDAQKNDFIWVSGFWRDSPTGRHWVPGFWAKVPKGYRWVSGHWAGEQERDYQFVEPPPNNPDLGPTTPAPDAESFYIPGTWFYGNQGYYWREGYWAGVRPGLIWVPACYFWTPYGWAFTNGYWDYALADRGLLFAPICITGGTFIGGFTYRPCFAVSFGVFAGSLFCHTHCGHYFFGNYYGSTHAGFGYVPWVTSAGRSFDPLFAHEQWLNRGNPNWLANQRIALAGRTNGTLPAPPRTLNDQVARSVVGSAGPAMLNTLPQVRNAGTPLEQLTAAQRSQQIQEAQRMLARNSDFRTLLSTSRFETTSLRPSMAATSWSTPLTTSTGTPLSTLHAPTSARPGTMSNFSSGGRFSSSGSSGGSFGGSHGGMGHGGGHR